MPYVRRTGQDSIPAVVPLLLASVAFSLFAVVYRRRTAPRRMSRVTTNVSPDAVLAAAPDVHDAALRSVHGGTGCIFHRRYEIALTGVAVQNDRVLRLMQRHLTDLAPSMLAHFEKTAGSDALLRVGDEYQITMLGPWNGLVRVVESTFDYFTLATLDGHPEVGHITFSVAHAADVVDAVIVRIESWARARDALVAAAYGTLGIGKQMQTEAWITFLQRLSARAGVKETPEVHITDEEIPVEVDGTADTPRAPHD